ncbi:uncharacterized protein LOC105438136 [Strongylocentrotus purpuratus]|uniref:WSC domain-containing protein n=1 Tax=Strongylocentrotus purpuratus TaxID=7668 RepID=A0A7M7NNW5_STRPU|nr:uncharacterized protein LOC105438136 [Strongylocentrotus purpuratus]
MDWHRIILVFLGIFLTQCSNHMVRCVITDVRLVGGPTSNKGTVEIRIDNGPWETTCEVNLDSSDVIVICRQLGFKGANIVIRDTHYGQNSTPTRGLGCLGVETDLSECPSFLSACSNAGGASCHGESYLGCFGKQQINHVLTGDKSTDVPDMTISYCIQFCYESATAKYIYAGVELGNNCLCGEANAGYPRQGEVSDAFCQAPCSGDPTESCGGYEFIAVFRIPMVPPTTTSITLTPSTSILELTSPNQVTTNNGNTSAIPSSSTASMSPKATFDPPGTRNNTGLYGGIGGGVAAFIILIIIIVIIFIMGRRSRKGRKDHTSSQRMSFATASTPTGINGLGISNAALEEPSVAGGSQLGLQASNNATASVLTASGRDKSGLLVNLNPKMSMNIYGGIDDEVLGDGMMPYASFDTAATVQNNNGRLSVVYAMPDKNGNEPRNDYEVITNEMAHYASVDNVSPMRPRTMPNKNDRLSVVYAAPDKNGNGPRNDTSEDFGSLYAIPDKPRGQPDGNDDGIVHGLYAKADESLSGDQYEPEMVENELYTI